MRDCISIEADEQAARETLRKLAAELGLEVDLSRWPAARCPGKAGFIAFWHGDRELLELYFPGQVPWAVIRRMFAGAVKG